MTLCNCRSRSLLARFPGQREAGAAKRGGIRRGGPAMQFENAPGNGQAEAVAAGGPVAGTIEAGKGRENVFAFFGRDANAVIVDVNHDQVVGQFGADENLLAGIFEGIAQQVAQGVGHGFAIEVDVEVVRQLPRVDRDFQLPAEQAYRIDFVDQPFGETDAGQMRFRRLALEACVSQAGVDQVIELFEIVFHHCPQSLAFIPLVGFGEHFQGKSHTGDRRAQLMGDTAGEFAVGSEQLLDAFGHAVHGVRQRGEELAASGGGACLEVAVAEVAGGLAQGFEVAPDRADPEPEGDAEDQAGQAPGQQTEAQFERQAILEFRIATGSQRADDQNLAAGAQTVIHDVAIVVDRNVAGVELVDLFRGQGAIQCHALDNAETIGKFFVEFLDFSRPGAARLAKQFILDQRDRATHEATGVIIGDAALGGRDDEVGGERDGDEGAHRQQIEVEEQFGQAIAPTLPAR